MQDGRIYPIAHEDVKTVLEQVVADNWQAKPLAQVLLSKLEELHEINPGPSEDRGFWLRNQLDELHMLLQVLEIRFFAHPPLLAKLGVKVTHGKATKALGKAK
jgi:hypothetical protein